MQEAQNWLTPTPAFDEAEKEKEDKQSEEEKGFDWRKNPKMQIVRFAENGIFILLFNNKMKMSVCSLFFYYFVYKMANFR